MNKRFFAAFSLIAALLLSGCSLAQPEREHAAAEEDRMVGVLVTREPLDLFDAEGYFRDHAGQIANGGKISDADAQRYQNALFAEWSEAEQRYVFAGADGYAWLCTEETDGESAYTRMQNDDVFCDGKSAVHVTDAGTSYDFSTTLYARNNAGSVYFVVNPLYQTGDGRVYARSGSGIRFSSDEGSTASTTQTLSQTLTRTENGEKQEYSFQCAVKIQLAPEPDSVTLFWMDAQNGVLRWQTYAAGTLPEALDAEGAKFLVAVQTSADGTQTRTLYNAEDETQQLETLREGSAGLLSMQYTTLNWN